MNVDFFAVLPVFFLVFLGFLARRFGFADKEFAKKLLELTLVVAFPATAFLALSKLRLSSGQLFLPLAPFVFVAIMFVVGKFLGKKLGLKDVQLGVFKTSLMIINTAFVLIFAIQMLGTEGVQKVFLVDLTGGLLVMSFIYSVSVKSSPNASRNSLDLLKRVLLFPPFLASVAGIFFVLFNWTVPTQVVSLLSPLDKMSFPLLAFSTGVLLELKIRQPRVVFTSVLTKMAGGFLLGLAFVSIVGLQGLDKAVLLATFSSPVGFNTVAFAAREKLDVELAASLFFVSALIGLFLVPVIFLLA